MDKFVELAMSVVQRVLSAYDFVEGDEEDYILKVT